MKDEHAVRVERKNEGDEEFVYITATHNGYQWTELRLTPEMARTAQHGIADVLRTNVHGETLLQQIIVEAAYAYDEYDKLRRRDPILFKGTMTAQNNKAAGICLGYYATIAILTGMCVEDVRARVIKLWEELPEDDEEDN